MEPKPACHLAFSPDGTRLVSGGVDRVVRVCDVGTGDPHTAPTLVLEGHRAEVCDVAFSPDGVRLASAGLDGTVRIWDATSGEQQLLLAGHTAGVPWPDWDPDGSRLLTGSRDRTAIVWNLRPDGSREWVTVDVGQPVFGVALDPAGERLAVSALTRVAVWDVPAASSSA